MIILVIKYVFVIIIINLLMEIVYVVDLFSKINVSNNALKTQSYRLRMDNNYVPVILTMHPHLMVSVNVLALI